MVRRKSRERESHWRAILKRQSKSGLSVRKFCESERISEPSFYAWRRKLRDRENSGARHARSGRQYETPGNDSLFVPVGLLGAPPTLEIIHPLGYRIQVTGDVDAVALSRVVEVLDERGGR